jgi:hypothetical protein
MILYGKFTQGIKMLQKTIKSEAIKRYLDVNGINKI